MSLDTWKPEWVRRVLAVGNTRGNAYWEAGLRRIPGPPKPTPNDGMPAVVAWCKAKYETRLFAAPGPSPNEAMEMPRRAAPQQQQSQQQPRSAPPPAAQQPLAPQPSQRAVAVRPPPQLQQPAAAPSTTPVDDTGFSAGFGDDASALEAAFSASGNTSAATASARTSGMVPASHRGFSWGDTTSSAAAADEDTGGNGGGTTPADFAFDASAPTASATAEFDDWGSVGGGLVYNRRDGRIGVGGVAPRTSPPGRGGGYVGAAAGPPGVGALSRGISAFDAAADVDDGHLGSAGGGGGGGDGGSGEDFWHVTSASHTPATAPPLELPVSSPHTLPPGSSSTTRSTVHSHGHSASGGLEYSSRAPASPVAEDEDPGEDIDSSSDSGDDNGDGAPHPAGGSAAAFSSASMWRRGSHSSGSSGRGEEGGGGPAMSESEANRLRILELRRSAVLTASVGDTSNNSSSSSTVSASASHSAASSRAQLQAAAAGLRSPPPTLRPTPQFDPFATPPDAAVAVAAGATSLRGGGDAHYATAGGTSQAEGQSRRSGETSSDVGEGGWADSLLTGVEAGGLWPSPERGQQQQRQPRSSSSSSSSAPANAAAPAATRGSFSDIGADGGVSGDDEPCAGSGRSSMDGGEWAAGGTHAAASSSSVVRHSGAGGEGGAGRRGDRASAASPLLLQMGGGGGGDGVEEADLLTLS